MSETIGSSGFGISIATPPPSLFRTKKQSSMVSFLARGKSHFLSQTGKRVNTMY